jgi:chemotaxis protein MotB
VGLSSAVLFDKKDPATAINRRISIIVMTRKAEAAAHATDDPTHTLSAVSPAGPAAAVAASPVGAAPEAAATSAH